MSSNNKKCHTILENKSAVQNILSDSSNKDEDPQLLLLREETKKWKDKEKEDVYLAKTFHYAAKAHMILNKIPTIEQISAMYHAAHKNK